MKTFSSDYLNELSKRAEMNPRLRQHHNIHQSFNESCQRLFNAIEPGSYIRPHRHATDPREEMLIAIRGLMALITFDDDGKITNMIRLGTEKFKTDVCAAAEVSSLTWHTVVALQPGCVLLEIKAGPFNPHQPKDLAAWAPTESSPDVENYLAQLVRAVGA